MSIPTAEIIRLARLGRQAERRRELRNGCITGLLTMAIHVTIGGWAFMLAVGTIRSEWIHQCPTIGYWDACLIAWLLRGALGIVHGTTNGDDRG